MILFGAGQTAQIALFYFREIGNPAAYICDNYKFGHSMCGIDVVGIERLKQADHAEQIVICNHDWIGVAEQLTGMGFYNLWIFQIESNVLSLGTVKCRIAGSASKLQRQLFALYLKSCGKELDETDKEAAGIVVDPDHEQNTESDEWDGYFAIWFEKYSEIIHVAGGISNPLAVRRYYGEGTVRKPFWVVYDPKSKDCLVDSVRKNYPIFTEKEGLLSVLPYEDEERVLLDLGANIGIVSLDFAAEGWQVFAAEAGRENAKMLSMAAAVNRYPVSVLNQAVWDRTGTLYFKEDGVSGMVVENEPEAVCIRAFALDDICEQELPEWRGLKKISLIKMDVEGAEVKAVLGGRNFLKQFSHPPVYCEANKCTLQRMGYQVTDLFRVFEEIGYAPFILWEDGLRVVNPAELQPKTVQDYLFLHEKDRKKIRKLYPKMERDEIRNLVLNEIRTMPEDYVRATRESLKNFPEYRDDDGIKTEVISGRMEIK